MKYNTDVDFMKAIRVLVQEFEERRIPYALIGAVALGFNGVIRNTKDIDFAVARDSASVANSIMEGLGYTLHQHTETFAQFSHYLKVFGDVDFMYLSADATREMLDNALVCPIAEGTLLVKVARPEDIFILKMVALKNNPKRTDRDIPDLRSLARLHRATMDWNRINEYAKLLGMESLVDGIR